MIEAGKAGYIWARIAATFSIHVRYAIHADCIRGCIPRKYVCMSVERECSVS